MDKSDVGYYWHNDSLRTAKKSELYLLFGFFYPDSDWLFTSKSSGPSLTASQKDDQNSGVQHCVMKVKPLIDNQIVH